MSQRAEDRVDDDVEAGPWEEEVTKSRPVSKKLSSIVSVRFSSDEAKIIRECATRLGITMSQFVRDSALSYAPGGFRFEITHSSTSGVTSNNEPDFGATRMISFESAIVFQVA